MLDMHFHSTFSDWKNSADEILSKARDIWLSYAFLTDHDRVSHYFVEKSKEYWIQTTYSTEISASNDKRDFSLHITYYAKQISNALENELNNTIESKIKLIQLQISRFKEMWFNINIWSFYKFCYKHWRKKENINKYDLARYLYEFSENIELVKKINNWVFLDLESFYLEFLKKDWKYFSWYWVIVPDYEVKISKIKKYAQIDSAIVSLAHPNFTFKSWIDEFIKNIDYYIENWWINAIEINTKATKQMVEAIIDLSVKKGLYITFWSDNHGLWTTDRKHWDFWVLNENITIDFIKKEFDRYKHLLWLI